jgi:hypothetical protein
MVDLAVSACCRQARRSGWLTSIQGHRVVRLKKGLIKTYKDLPHGMLATHPEIINADLSPFMRA